MASLSRITPDVMVINFELSDDSGLLLLKKLNLSLPRLPITVMLANKSFHDETVLAMKYGATDVLVAPWDHERLLSSVRDVLRKDVRRRQMATGFDKLEVTGFSSLTSRERQVLEAIVNGRSNKEAGRDLKISSRTVEVHRARIMKKLDVRNTVELIRTVIVAG